ncbi:chaplin family protein [Streptomyces sp. NPDC007084]|uniref:chaplin n=1 Tax=Streptomyces sp. NPDC007084 TaxID=3154313 RepID=UPI0034558316
MKRVTRNGLIAAAAASGALAATVPAHADSAADGTLAGSPGVISGNTVQLPVHVPVNVCGNTVNVVGLLNPAAGNRCANVSDGGGAASHSSGGKRSITPAAQGESGGRHAGGPVGGSGGGAVADGSATDSPGLLSGNGLQLPVQLPVNVSGNSVNVVGIGNPAFGNESANTSGEHPEPVHPVTPPAKPTVPVAPAPAPEHPKPGVPGEVRTMGDTGATLAHTGADGVMPAVAVSAAMLLGGAVMFRRFRPAAVR